MTGKVSCDLGYKCLGREVSSSDYRLRPALLGNRSKQGGEVTWRTGERPLSLC